jgi:dTDP-glucose 4,6-dehydratase
MSTNTGLFPAVRTHRIIATGVTGTLGQHVVNELAIRPVVKVLALMRTTSQIRKTVPAVRYERVDFSEPNSFAQVMMGFRPTAMIHCAATGMQLPRPGWEEFVRFNVESSVRLCELTARMANCHFVFVGTGLAYRDLARPLKEVDALETRNPYAASKAAADMLVQAAAAALAVPVTVLRPFSFSGPGDVGSRLFPSLLRAAERNESFDLSPGDQIRDHCAATDIAHGLALAATQDSASADAQVFNLGSGRALALRPLT